MKKKILTLALTTVFISLMALGSAAYFTAEGRATNVITTGAVEMKLEEMQLVEVEGEQKEVPYPEDTITGVMPGRTVSKIPYVVGEAATQPFYTRVKAVLTITLADGTVTETNEYVFPNYDRENWILGEDGWWYYKGQVKAGEDNKVALFTEVFFAPQMPDTYQGCTVKIDVSAQAVQAKNNPVPEAGYTAIQGWPEEIAE